MLQVNWNNGDRTQALTEERDVGRMTKPTRGACDAEEDQASPEQVYVIPLDQKTPECRNDRLLCPNKLIA